MLTNRNSKALVLRCCLLAVLLLGVTWARSQVTIPSEGGSAVYVLKATDVDDLHGTATLTSGSTTQAFDFYRNLIFFPARMDGKLGNFILDTGAPTLLINSRNEPLAEAEATGFGTGGELKLAHRKVESLEIGGHDLGKRWGLALDLRAMEERTGRRIDGFIGYDLLHRQELRIDYQAREFSLQKSSRNPLHEGREPDHVMKLEFVDHLPLLRLKIGKHKLRFILDTGAASNLLDQQYANLGQPTGTQMNIQGLDGNNTTHDMVQLAGAQLALASGQQTFVAMDLSHLQSPQDPPVAGILGSAFLDRYVVGIDYRRQKLYLWYPLTNKQLDSK